MLLVSFKALMRYLLLYLFVHVFPPLDSKLYEDQVCVCFIPQCIPTPSTVPGTYFMNICWNEMKSVGVGASDLPPVGLREFTS